MRNATNAYEHASYGEILFVLAIDLAMCSKIPKYIII